MLLKWIISSLTMSRCLQSILQDDDLPKLPLYAGVGYDLVVGNPHTDKVDPGFRSEIFELKYSQSQKTEDGKFQIPDGTVSHNRYSCAYSATTSEFTGASSYQNTLKDHVSLSFDIHLFIVNASFSGSKEFDQVHNISSSEHSVFVEAGARCEAYSLEVPHFATLPLSADFKTGVLSAFKGETSWNKILEVFGTSYVNKVILGGRAHLFQTLKETSYQELRSMDMNLNLTAKFSFAKWSGDASGDWQNHTSEIQQFENRVEERKEIFVGGKPPKSGDWHDWQELVSSEPAPISYYLSSLLELFTQGNFPELNAEQISQMKAQFNDSLVPYCKDKNCFIPDTDNPFPPGAVAVPHRTYHEGPDVGTPFEDPFPTNPMMRVIKVIIDDCGYISRVQLLVSDGVKFYYTGAHGEPRGTRVEWDVPESELITQVEVRYESFVYSLKFITNQGSMSPQFGSNGGLYAMHNLEGHLVGMYGYAQDRVYQIAFLSNEVVYPNNTSSHFITRNQMIVESD